MKKIEIIKKFHDEKLWPIYENICKLEASYILDDEEFLENCANDLEELKHEWLKLGEKRRGEYILNLLKLLPDGEKLKKELIRLLK